MLYPLDLPIFSGGPMLSHGKFQDATDGAQEFEACGQGVGRTDDRRGVAGVDHWIGFVGKILTGFTVDRKP